MLASAIKRYHSVALTPQEVSANLSWLKLAAMAAMLLDHIAAAYLQLWPNTVLEYFLRMPGRISIPIFALLVAYGFAHYSSNRVHYALRLWLFAAISEPAYITFFGKAGNALLPLALGATALLLAEEVKGRFVHAAPLIAIVLTGFFAWLTQEAAIIPVALLVVLFYAAIRYGQQLALWTPLIAAVIVLCNKWEWQYFVMVPVTTGLIAASLALRSQLPAVRIWKWAGYGFYPAHLAGLALGVHALSS